MSLKEIVREKIIKEVIVEQRESGQWKVLIVDRLAMRILNACCKMHELMSESVTLIEDLTKRREPLRDFEAIYLITPIEESIRALMSDFELPHKCLYKAAHVYFTEACPDELFSELTKHQTSRYLKTLKEINIAFLPVESRVFSLDAPDAFHYFYHSEKLCGRTVQLEKVAEQLATVCACLGEYPNIRYRREFDKNAEFVQMLQTKLDQYKADDPTMGEGAQRERSLLLLVDRGFDPITPLLHELTLQAMAYDLLSIENDVYCYEHEADGETTEKQVPLDEDDEVYVKLRHKHIAVVMQQVTKDFKDFMAKHKQRSEKANIRDVGQLLKRMPQYRKELSCYRTHLRLAEDCMGHYQLNVNRLCKVEQNLAMGRDADGEKIRDQMRSIVPILLDNDISTYDKIRVILLYIIHKGGISAENLIKLCQHAQIPMEERCIVSNMTNLGTHIIQESGRKANEPFQASVRRERVSEDTYQVSRWTPYLKDIIEDLVEDKLDSSVFPFLPGAGRKSMPQGTAVSARYGAWHQQKSGTLQAKALPRLIVFIMGGVTYSELRTAYEICEAQKTFDVLIGSTEILKPEVFLQGLKNLSKEQ